MRIFKKEETLKLYTFEELSADVQSAVLKDFKEMNMYIYDEENMESVQKIEEYCGVSFNQSADKETVDYVPSYRYLRFSPGQMKGSRAWSWLERHVLQYLRNDKGKFKTDCPFTGYYLDCVFFESLDAWEKSLKTKGKSVTLADFFKLLASKLSQAINEDHAYLGSREYLLEHDSDLGILYTSDGQSVYEEELVSPEWNEIECA